MPLLVHIMRISLLAIGITNIIQPIECFSTPSKLSTSSSYHHQQHQHQLRLLSRYQTTTRISGGGGGTCLKSTTEEEATTTSQDGSIVYYDDFLDPDNPMGVVCARGVCVLPDDDEYDFSAPDDGAGQPSIIDKILSSYLGPRLLLGFASILYGTNFPLGAMMNEALPPSAATSARMLLASLALSPFLFKLESKLAPTALLCGCFTALGYITQSLALVDISPAKVSFIGAAVVLVCPALEFFVNKKDMSIRNQPQVWLAATLCIVGVGVLELYDPTGATALSDVFSQIGMGDFLAFLQAVGFGTSFFITERMMTEVPGQALPITAVQVSVSALLCMFWCIMDGWVGTAGSESYGLPMLLFEPSLKMAASAVLWTGFMTTALNRFVETTALGKMKSAEASVILATEPLWAALFAALWLSTDFGANDYIGGALIVAACLATSLQKDDFKGLFDLLGDGDESPNEKSLPS
jgi:drug/metabolite transporter (DMT)-like permease